MPPDEGFFDPWEQVKAPWQHPFEEGDAVKMEAHTKNKKADRKGSPLRPVVKKEAPL